MTPSKGDRASCWRDLRDQRREGGVEVLLLSYAQ